MRHPFAFGDEYETADDNVCTLYIHIINYILLSSLITEISRSNFILERVVELREGQSVVSFRADISFILLQQLHIHIHALSVTYMYWTQGCPIRA